MTARRRIIRRKHLEHPGTPERTSSQKALAAAGTVNEAGSGNCPDGTTEKRQGSLPVAVVLDIIAGEYNKGAGDEVLCRLALRLAEESGIIESYRARWDEEFSSPTGPKSSLLFDRNQCLELINYYQRRGNTDKLALEKKKLVQIEGRLLLGASGPLRITDEDLDKLEEFIKESGF